MMKFSKKHIIIISILIVSVLLTVINALYVRGICFEQTGGFRYSEYREFFRPAYGYDTLARIVDGYNKSYGIPFVIMFYPLDSPPYDVQLDIGDNTQTIKSLVIESVYIDFDDGTTVQKELQWQEDFIPFELQSYITGELTTDPIRRLDAKLLDIIEKSRTCYVTLDGYLIRDNDVKVDYNKRIRFEYEPTFWRVHRGLHFHSLHLWVKSMRSL